MRVKNGITMPQEEKIQVVETPEQPKEPLKHRKTEQKRERGTFGSRMLVFDKLLRNVAVTGALLLTILAVRNAGLPQSQSVFSALQDGMNMEWDESLGKLSFVTNLLPDSIQAVWNESEAITVLAPANGQIVHAWSQEEPYLELKGVVSDVRAVANGEIMSIAHGLDDELIVRLRHDDRTESVYGNLVACYMDVGAYVYEGDLIARVLDGKPLAFELRRDGRSIDPEGKLKSWSE